MTPDKIKEGFGAYEKEYWDSEALCGKTYREWTDQNYVEMATSYQRRAWQACAEWILSQASEKDNEVFNKEIAEWSEKFKQVFSNNNGEFLGHTALHFFKRGLSLARLSSAKEITSLKDQILRYEHDNRELRAKSLNEIAEKDARIEQLESMIENGLGWEDMKNETTYPNG